MTLYVNLFAGPGCGKSTTAAGLFASLKMNGMNCELNQEYVKQWSWEDRKPASYDQFYFFGKQTRREYTLAGKVDVVVTDAPSMLTAYYTQLYGEASTASVFRMMALEYRRMLEADGHQMLDVFLTRKKAYDSRGRFQNEAEAIEIDTDLRAFLKSMKVSLTEVPGDISAVSQLTDLIIARGKV